MSLESKMRKAATDFEAELEAINAGDLIRDINGHRNLSYSWVYMFDVDRDIKAIPHYTLGMRCEDCGAVVYKNPAGGISGIALDAPCNGDTRRVVTIYERWAEAQEPEDEE